MKKEEQSETNGHAMGGTADAIILDGKVVNSNDVIAMKKEIDDLQLVNESRDNRISEVCTAFGIWDLQFIDAVCVCIYMESRQSNSHNILYYTVDG